MHAPTVVKIFDSSLLRIILQVIRVDANHLSPKFNSRLNSVGRP